MSLNLLSPLRVGLRPLAVLAFLSLALSSSPLFAQGKLALVSLDGRSVVKAERGSGPSIIDMGTVRVGFIRILALGYSNVGGGTITDIEVSELTGANPEVFAITRDECTGQTLAPGAMCVLELRFEPPDMASYSADFEITSTAVNSPDEFRLIGAGIFDELFRDRFEEG